jgi:hypothetical protein
MGSGFIFFSASNLNYYEHWQGALDVHIEHPVIKYSANEIIGFKIGPTREESLRNSFPDVQ